MHQLKELKTMLAELREQKPIEIKVSVSGGVRAGLAELKQQGGGHRAGDDHGAEVAGRAVGAVAAVATG